jgi:hypothetical protein
MFSVLQKKPLQQFATLSTWVQGLLSGTQGSVPGGRTPICGNGAGVARAVAKASAIMLTTASLVLHILDGLSFSVDTNQVESTCLYLMVLEDRRIVRREA